MADYNFDVGQNVTTLGFLYLFFRYVWPVILFIVIAIVIGVAAWLFVPYITTHPINFPIPTLPQAPQVT